MKIRDDDSVREVEKRRQAAALQDALRARNQNSCYNHTALCCTGKKPEGRGIIEKAAEHRRTPRRKRKTNICIRGHVLECGGLTPLSQLACN